MISHFNLEKAKDLGPRLQSCFGLIRRVKEHSLSEGVTRPVLDQLIEQGETYQSYLMMVSLGRPPNQAEVSKMLSIIEKFIELIEVDLAAELPIQEKTHEPE